MSLLSFLFGSAPPSRRPKSSAKGKKVVDVRKAKASDLRSLGLETPAQARTRQSRERAANLRAEVARRKAEAERERERKLLEEASHARTATRKKAIESKAHTAAKKADALDDTASRVESLVAKANRGERLSTTESDELRRAMAGGVLGLRKNPHSNTRSSVKNPHDGALLNKAVAMAKEFHGEDGAMEVVELEEDERRPPSRYGVIIGEVEDITYGPDHYSERGDDLWRHESGDRGPLSKRSRNKPLLIADPVTKRAHIIQDRSPMKFDPRKGLVG